MLNSERRLSGLALACLGCVFFVSRWPFIRSGYGLDPDAYIVMLSAQKMLATGKYWMSRPPGYPLFEIVCALLSPGGFLATNGMTLLVSSLSIFSLVHILRSFRVRNQGWLLATFCFIPIIWIQSTCTMDYMWAFFFIMLAVSCFLSRKYLAGAIFLGIAVGFRITSGIMILPLSLHLFYQEGRKIRKIASTIFLFGSVCLLVYTPVFLSYRLSFLSYLPSKDPLYVWGYRTLSELLGIPAFLVLAWGIFLFIFKEATNPKKSAGRLDAETQVLLLIVVSYGLLFLKLPAEASYLIPLIPFGLILLDRIFSRKLFTLFCILVILNGVVSIAAIDKKAYRKDGQIKFIPFDYGTVIKNEIRKRSIYQNAQKLLPIAESLPGGNKIAIVVNWYLPTFQFLNRDVLEEVIIDHRIPALKRKGKKLFFLESVTDEEVRFLRESEFTLYYLDAARGSESSTGADLFTCARQIPGIDSYPVNY